LAVVGCSLLRRRQQKDRGLNALRRDGVALAEYEQQGFVGRQMLKHRKRELARAEEGTQLPAMKPAEGKELGHARAILRQECQALKGNGVGYVAIHG